MLQEEWMLNVMKFCKLTNYNWDIYSRRIYFLLINIEPNYIAQQSCTGNQQVDPIKWFMSKCKHLV